MLQAPANLQALIQPTVEMLGYELLGIEYLPQGKHSLLRIYIDSENGIMLEDCEKISHQLSGVLDVEEAVQGRYNLEVSSPGLDRPLFSEEQFLQFCGHKVKVKLRVPVDGRKKFKGVIQSVSEGNVIFNISAEHSEPKRSSNAKASAKLTGAKLTEKSTDKSAEELPKDDLELTVPFNSIDKANLIPDL